MISYFPSIIKAFDLAHKFKDKEISNNNINNNEMQNSFNWEYLYNTFFLLFKKTGFVCVYWLYTWNFI